MVLLNMMVIITIAVVVALKLLVVLVEVTLALSSKVVRLLHMAVVAAAVTMVDLAVHT
jgi:hypothetical protein